MKNVPEEIEGIQITDHIKYLGTTIDNKKNYFKTQKENMFNKAINLSNMTYSVIEKSCNKLLIGKTYWKSVALQYSMVSTTSTWPKLKSRNFKE